MRELEHPDVSAALSTGYPWGEEAVTDTPEERVAFAEDYAREFVSFTAENQPEAVDAFVEEYRWMYEDWLG